MRSAFDFAPFRRSTVGFDRLFDMLENSNAGQAPGELSRRSTSSSLATTSFGSSWPSPASSPNEIDITAQQNVLVVTGQEGRRSRASSGSDYIYRGIATRSFERRFALADHIQVRGADLKDGLLAIELVREIPEAMKPRKIDIGGSGSEKPASQQTLEAERA